MKLSDIISNLFPTVYAEEATHVEDPYINPIIVDNDDNAVQYGYIVEEHHPAKQEQIQEPNMEQIYRGCIKPCLSARKPLDDCNARVENGSNEDCAEEVAQFLNCLDACAAPKIFPTTK
ncbi:uncharacterized protein BX664DRAFT_333796 [Halteromyces radiatus]|uniref:uncharacterized protein n=1 Tax=Halteromyces radiatus TaxID=101107 RepID=UPI00221ECA18|nr:uncharacterized protein BX664DRAFT_333796 [Halteromyces radiatus]KAI8089747.1 hypothetical protein BX664DRAFT_333796 [Halteromyces radiatus]